LTSNSNITLIEGNARFTGKKLLEIELSKGGTEKIKSEYIIINTGTSSSMPPIPGLDRVDALDSTSIMEIDKIPEHLLVIGGGYVGLEFGQMFRRFGSKVTILQLEDQLLPLEDKDVAEEITKILQQEGLQILLKANTTKIDVSSEEKIALSVKVYEKEQSIEGTHLLVATGRVPNTSFLNPKATGITLDKKGFIPVNDYLETSVPGIFAIGDVKGGPAFTHISYDDHLILLKNFFEGSKATISGRILPYVVFIDPQLGRIGLNEKQAKEQGYDYRIAKIPMSWVARAIETDETKGLMKAIIDYKTKQILGAAILGIEGGELMTAIQIAMLGNLPYTALRDGMFAHPTLSESFNTLFGALNS
jgi:pyruvate/2-oxoglutarate dehydrogenase complex dihydrolipoamide dehydrogenase (E3) component